MTDRGATHGPAEYEFSSETSNAHIHITSLPSTACSTPPHGHRNCSFGVRCRRPLMGNFTGTPDCPELADCRRMSVRNAGPD